MLSKGAIAAAYPLAELLDARNLTVQPVSGSFLESLVSAGYGYFNYTDDENGGVKAGDPTPFAVGDGEKVDELSLRMEAAVKMITKSVQDQIVFIRNEVSPNVCSLVESTSKALEDYTKSKLSSMDVVPVAYPQLLDNGAFAIMINEYRDLPGYTSNFPFTFGLRTGTEVIELMKTGTSSVDKDIDAWVKSRGYDFFAGVWMTYFSNVGGLPDFQKSLSNDEFETALTVFLLARNLHGNPADSQRLSLPQYNDAMENYRNQAARYLSIQMKTYDGYFNNKFVVMTVIDRVTNVIGKNYDKFIEAGGNVEVIFGNAVENGKYRTIDDLLTNAPSLTESWRRYTALVSTNESLQRASNTRRFLTDYFRAMVAGKANYEQLVNKFSNALTEVYDNELADLHSVVTKVLCDTLYDNTDAKEILMETFLITKNNPDLPLREARSFAIKNYIDRFINSQMTLVKV